MTNYFRHPLNLDKRHLIVGDVHGRFDTFISLLQAVDYNEEQDIIYSVGDLIDRGPKAVEVVEFFTKQSAFAVLGNHEQMVNNPADWLKVWMYPPHGGPNTLDSLDHHGKDINWLREFCSSLPICIDVGEEDDPNAFRIIHAECSPSMSEDDFRNYLLSYPDEAPEGELLWGRSTITRALKNIKHLKPSHHGIFFHENYTTRNVFSGHTPTERVITVRNMKWIDTFCSNTMTIIDAITLESVSVPVIDS